MRKYHLDTKGKNTVDLNRSVLRSPFSVLRSPFSVLRSPFSVSSLNKSTLVGFILVAVLAILFAACNDLSSGNPTGGDPTGGGGTTVPVTSVTLNKTSLTLTAGSSEVIYATVNPSNATDKSVSWKSNKIDVAVVDDNGYVIAVAEGTAIITVTTANSGKTANCLVTVSAQTVNFTVEPIPEQTYTGSPIQPTVTVKDGTTTLVLDTDYTVAYNDNTHVGYATATVTGIGKYEGTYTEVFSIKPKDIALTTVEPIPTQEYTGSAFKPNVTITDGEATLALDTDYTVGYTSNTNVGTATVTIHGMGNYEGSNSTTFSIKARDITVVEIDITAPVKDATPKTTASGTGDFTISTVSWSPDHKPFQGGTKYTATVTLTAKTGYTFTGLASATMDGQSMTISSNTGTSVTLSHTFSETDNRIVTNIAIKTPPTILTGYTHGDQLDLTGLVVTLTHNDTTTEDVAVADFSAKHINATPSQNEYLRHLTHNGNPVTITYGDLTPLTTDNVTVNQKALTITGVTATSRVYNGTTTVTLSGYPSLQGRVLNDSVSYTLGTGTLEDADAGNGKAVTTNIQLGGAGAGNYILTQPTVTVNIAKAQGATLVTPAYSSITANSITIYTTVPSNGQSVEYAINAENFAPSSGWQDSETFTGLIEGSVYYLFARSKENTNYNTGTTTNVGLPVAIYSTANAVWARSVISNSSRADSQFNGVAVDSSGNVYAAGYQAISTLYTYGTGVSVQGNGTYSSTATSVTLVKYDTNGTAQWAKSLFDTVEGGASFNAVAADASGNVYVAGQKGYWNAVLIKCDANGTVLWTKSGNPVRFFAVAIDSSGNVYAAGFQEGNSSVSYGDGVSAKGDFNLHNAVLVKYDSNGIAQWARTVVAGNRSEFNAVAVDPSGNVYAAGYQYATGTFNYGDGVSVLGINSSLENAVLVKYDTNGTALWARSTSSDTFNSSTFNAVAVDTSGNVYAAGSRLIKFDTNGTMLWVKGAVTGVPTFNAVAVDLSGNVYVAGSQSSNATYGEGVYAREWRSGTSVVLVKYGSNGTAQWAKSNYNNNYNTNAKFNAVAVNPSGSVYAAGYQGEYWTYIYGNGVTVNGATYHQGIDDKMVVLVKYQY